MLTFFWYLLLVAEVVMGLLLVLLVLLQRSREEGLGMTFGNAMGESLFGAQAATVLTKATVILGVLFLLNTVALGRLGSTRWNRTQSVMDSVPDGAAVPVEFQTLPMGGGTPVFEDNMDAAGGPVDETAPVDLDAIPFTPAGGATAVEPAAPDADVEPAPAPEN